MKISEVIHGRSVKRSIGCRPRRFWGCRTGNYGAGGGGESFAAVSEKYFDLNVKHFVEKLHGQEQIQLSYTWVKTALQNAGLVKREAERGPHRRKRPRRPIPGMMLHVDGSRHRWIPGLDQYQDLIVIFDDATSEAYDVQLVEEESTVTVMGALKRVVEQRGLFCSLYSERGSHMASMATCIR